MVVDRTHSSAAQAPVFSISRPKAGRASGGAHWDSVRLADRDPVGGFAQRDGLRMRHDLLEAAARLAGGRRVGRHPPSSIEQASRGRQDRLVVHGCRQFQRPRCFWGAQTGPNPTDRGKNGSKHHVLVDGHGTPMAKAVTGANTHDVTQLIPLVDAVPPVSGKRGRPRRRPRTLWADKAYDSMAHRVALWERGIEPVIPKRGTGAPRDWDPFAGSSSAPSVGCINSDDCECEMNAAPTFMKPSSQLDVS